MPNTTEWKRRTDEWIAQQEHSRRRKKETRDVRTGVRSAVDEQYQPGGMSNTHEALNRATSRIGVPGNKTGER